MPQAVLIVCQSEINIFFEKNILWQLNVSVPLPLRYDVDVRAGPEDVVPAPLAGLTEEAELGKKR